MEGNPPTTSRRVCAFFFYSHEKKYQTRLYVPSLSNDKISTEEIEKLMAEIDELLQTCTSKYFGFPIKSKRKTIQAFLDHKAWSFKERGFKWVIPFYFPETIELWTDEPIQAIYQVDNRAQGQDEANNVGDQFVQPEVWYVPNNVCIVRVDPEVFRQMCLQQNNQNLRELRV